MVVMLSEISSNTPERLALTSLFEETEKRQRESYMAPNVPISGGLDTDRFVGDIFLGKSGVEFQQDIDGSVFNSSKSTCFSQSSVDEVPGVPDGPVREREILEMEDRSRDGNSAKPLSRPPGKAGNIHNAAQAGDVEAVRWFLENHPSSINQRNSLLCQTPLHAAAAEDRTVVLQLLLEWPGEEKSDIEARNMFGETPLHMAAKNGAATSARLLLERGADTNVRATNGMTPLHLAVWSCVRTEDTSMVELLLEHQADLSAQDKDEKTPMNHLPMTCSNVKLQGLLQSHLERQTRLKAAKACENAKQVMVQLEEELERIVGLRGLKEQLRAWAKGMILDQRRRALGLSIRPRCVPHMAFLGSPGTGKTTVARVLARLLHLVGMLATEKVVEVQRTDLVGEFVGHTGPKTRKKIAEAEGGILFVDEAYRLIPAQKSDEKDYGVEALEEIMSVMDSGKVAVIFAGYAEPMRRVFGANEGFQRRVSKHFTFDDLTPSEIAQVMLLKMQQQSEDSALFGFQLEKCCTEEVLAHLVVAKTTEDQRKQRNGGMALPVLLDARDCLDSRLDIECIDRNELTTICVEDISRALSMVPN